VEHAGQHEQVPEQETPEQHWESRYADSGPVWSGRPNASLVAVVAGLPAGRALDLGCGEGGDVVWLAQRGWHITGVDISPTAVARADAAARAGGVADRIELVATNLAHWRTAGTFDLVSACFLHSTVELPRTEILRAAAGAVAPGGRLLVVSHAAAPPWADVPHGHEHLFLTPEQEVAALALPAEEWVSEVTEVRRRDATGPDGRSAVLDDTVVLLRRV